MVHCVDIHCITLFQRYKRDVAVRDWHETETFDFGSKTEIETFKTETETFLRPYMQVC